MANSLNSFSDNAKKAMIQGVDDDLASLSSGTSPTQRGFNSKRDGEDVQLPGQTETRLVNRSKMCVYLVILLSAGLVGGLTYWLLSEEEKVWYEDEFDEFSETVFQKSKANMDKLKQITHATSSAYTSAGIHSGDDGAELHAATINTTIDNFGVLAGNFRTLGRAELVVVAPLVPVQELTKWEEYAVAHQDWISEDLTVSSFERADHTHEEENDQRGYEDEKEKILDSLAENQDEYIFSSNPGPIHATVQKRDTNDSSPWHVPIWQINPTPQNAMESPIMMDLMSYHWFRETLFYIMTTRKGAFTPMLDLEFLLEYQESLEDSHIGSDNEPEDHDGEDEDDRRNLQDENENEGKENDSDDEHRRRSLYLEPVFGTFDYMHSEIIAITLVVIDWDKYFNGMLEEEAAGFVIDLEFSCPGQEGTRRAFKVTQEDGEVAFLGDNIAQNPKYKHMIQRETISGASSDEEIDDDSGDKPFEHHANETCSWVVSTAANDEFVSYWQTNDAIVYTIGFVSIFFFTAFVFLVYDCLVQHRNQRVVKTAERSTAIVTSLFPRNVAEQMMEETNTTGTSNKHATYPTRRALKSIGSSSLEPTASVTASNYTKPIADLFRDTTILFADIAGFTAWSSTREPEKVFTLLETIFNSYDAIAIKRKVFKVETVGDCYVAVCGLPEPNTDHAIVMCRFARDCMIEMGRIVKQLEPELGPDTSTLDIRIGMHSGPVTAGVLRGQRARFQLFGDTMNKTSRIETTGKPGRIHLSKETADIVIASGRGHWVQQREDAVNLKGLGQMNTYWLNFQNDADGATQTSDTVSNSDANISESAEAQGSRQVGVVSSSSPTHWQHGVQKNLVKWHKEVLSLSLRKVISYRIEQKLDFPEDEDSLVEAEAKAVFGEGNPGNCVDFPIIDAPIDSAHVVLSPKVELQLGEFVEDIARCYNPHPFHNFEHASHVCLSVAKLLSHMQSDGELSLDDPMTQFVVILTGLMHDVDHPGVGNSQLIAERHTLTQKYKSSIAERHSLDVTWDLLKKECYHDLRRAIYSNISEFEHFRELMVHAVLVTDIMDKDLQGKRKARWNKIFKQDCEGMNPYQLLNMQKTAVLETIIQISDISHTMQHWNVYQKFNHRLYHELKEAYEEDRASKDPSEFWYDGELGFFDYYIIPLAEQLEECPAFYSSGQELLLYARSNRTEWESKGLKVVETLKGAKPPTTTGEHWKSHSSSILEV